MCNVSILMPTWPAFTDWLPQVAEVRVDLLSSPGLVGCFLLFSVFRYQVVAALNVNVPYVACLRHKKNIKTRCTHTGRQSNKKILLGNAKVIT